MTAEVAKQSYFKIVGGQAIGTYRLLSGFSGLADMPAEFQNAMDYIINNAKITFWFLDDISLVTKRAGIGTRKAGHRGIRKTESREFISQIV